MRIAIFTDTYTPDTNGVALTLQRWVNYLKHHNYDVRVFAPAADTKDQLTPDEAVHRYASFPFFLYPELRAAIPKPTLVTKELDDFHPTLIHVATPFNMGLIGRSYALKNNIPLLASYHTNFNQYLASYKLEWAEQLLENYLSWFHAECAAVFAPSKVTAQELISKNYPNVSIWGRGIDTSQFFPATNPGEIKKKIASRYHVSSTKLNILYVGRLAAEKSLNIFMDVAWRLPAHLKEKVQFILVGDGPEKTTIEEFIIQKQLTNVHLIGFVENHHLNEIYQCADIFFFPSQTETFGNVVLEAQACGLPVIGANAGGVRNLVLPLYNGILCAPNSSTNFLNALIYLIENKEVRKIFANNAYSFAQTQDWNSIFEDLVAQYIKYQAKTIHI